MIGRPTAGARLEIERITETDAAVGYRGFVFLPDAEVPAEVTVELPSGTVRARLEPVGAVTPERVAELERTAVALVRAATKAAASAGRPLPRKIVRWRP